LKIKKPRRLKQGDTVAVLSPSWGGPCAFPHIYEEGLKTLRNLGLNIKEYPTAKADDSYLARNPKARAQDINNAFADKNVAAIITTIGGDDSVRILPYLNPRIIRNNPKILLGYSDTTTIHSYCNQLGVVTFYGPSIMAGLSQWKSLSEEFKTHVTTMLFESPKTYQYTPWNWYSEKYPDWKDPRNAGQISALKRSDGWHWLQGNTKVKGELFGGCIDVLEFLKGTEYWPKKNFWKGKILLLETSEDKPTPTHVRWMLRNYGMQGIFSQISALLVGRARDYSPEEKKALDEILVQVVAEEFGRTDLPIISNMDFGHTDPQQILPLGILAEVDCKKRAFRLLESPTVKKIVSFERNPRISPELTLSFHRFLPI
jgi:muramoyltetrapeptide carboxypeptidase LdcA involved in peptidoglycan recycling